MPANPTKIFVRLGTTPTDHPSDLNKSNEFIIGDVADSTDFHRICKEPDGKSVSLSTHVFLKIMEIFYALFRTKKIIQTEISIRFVISTSFSELIIFLNFIKFYKSGSNIRRVCTNLMGKYKSDGLSDGLETNPIILNLTNVNLAESM